MVSISEFFDAARNIFAPTHANPIPSPLDFVDDEIM